MIFEIKEYLDIDKAFRWADPLITKALSRGKVILELRRELGTDAQRRKMWAVISDFEKSKIIFNGRTWKKEEWKVFLMSAFNKEMPKVGLLGEPVTMNTSTNDLSKSRKAEFIEFVYATGVEFGVEFSDEAIEVYQEFGLVE